MAEPWLSAGDIAAHLGIGRLWKFQASEIDDWVREAAASSGSQAPMQQPNVGGRSYAHHNEVGEGARMTLSEAQRLVKSKQRDADHGEVFTPAWMVEGMGLTVKDFRLLVNLGVFNATDMNQAAFALLRDQDSSLSYTGIESHKGLRRYGLYDSVVAVGETTT